MSQTTRIYVIDGKRLVRAPTSAQALRYIMKEIPVKVASQRDLERLLLSGAKVEESNGQDE